MISTVSSVNIVWVTYLLHSTDEDFQKTCLPIFELEYILRSLYYILCTYERWFYEIYLLDINISCYKHEHLTNPNTLCNLSGSLGDKSTYYLRVYQELMKPCLCVPFCVFISVYDDQPEVETLIAKAIKWHKTHPHKHPLGNKNKN